MRSLPLLAAILLLDGTASAAQVASNVDPETGWNHADRGAPGRIPCEKMAREGKGQLAPGFLAECRRANAEQRRPGF